MQNLLNILTIIILTNLVCSCAQNNSNGKQTQNANTKDNISTTISEDTAILGQLLDLSVYRPTSAKFKYAFIDNSGQNQRLSVPAPSDSFLEAILYFDSLTFRKFKTSYFNADYVSPNFNKEEFNFDWLDKNIKDELIKSDTTYHGHPDFYFGIGKSGKLWLLDKKVLVRKSTT